MRRLSHRRVVDAQIAGDGTHDDLAGIQTDTNLREDAFLPAHGLPVPLDGFLHSQGRIAGPHGVILVGERSTKQGHDPVTHHLVDGPFVSMHRLHHVLKDRIKDPPGVLRIAIGEKLH